MNKRVDQTLTVFTQHAKPYSKELVRI